MGKAPKNTPSVCAVIGADPFLRHEALARLIGAVRGEMEELGPSRCDGSQASAADVLDEVRTPSLLGDRRVVIVEDADDFISANRAALEKYCASPAVSGCLILLCDSLPRNTKLYGILAARDAVVTCEKLTGQAFSKWIAQRAEKEYGKQIAAQAVQSLRRLLGDSPGWIDAELAKLAAYVGERKEIAAADVEELTDHRREEKVFAVIEAVSQGDAPAALKQWEQVLATDRAAPGRAIAGLAYSMRQLVEAKRELESSGNVFQSAKRMFTDAGALRQRLERLPAGRLMEQQRDLLAADLAVKTGLSTLESAIERFIVKHSSSVRVPQTRTG
jgi:DNA polymerase-3 subunit delta